MRKHGTGLAGASYSLQRIFWFFWRWEAAAAGRQGIAVGRRAAMRAARTLLRNRKAKVEMALEKARPPAPVIDALRVEPVAFGIDEPRLENAEIENPKPGGARPRHHCDRDAPYARRPDHSGHALRH